MKKFYTLLGVIAIGAVIAIALTGCNNPAGDDGGNGPDKEQSLASFPEGAVTAEAIANCEEGDKYWCDFINNSSQTVYVKSGNTIKSITPNGRFFGFITSDIPLATYTYAPADLVKVVGSDTSNSYNIIPGTVRFIESSVTTGDIKVRNGTSFGGRTGGFTKTIIKDIETGAIIMTDTTTIGVYSERVYSNIPAGKSYYVEVDWNGYGGSAFGLNTTFKLGGTNNPLSEKSFVLPAGAEADISIDASARDYVLKYQYDFLKNY